MTTASYDKIIEKAINCAKKRKRLTIAPIASHPIILAYKDTKVKKILNSFDMTLPDSQYVKWALNYLYNLSIKNRIYGPELFLRLCKQAEKNKLKIFLYGNNIKLLKEKLKEKFPRLNIDGLDLKYKKIDLEKDLEILKIKLKNSKPEMLIIGLGSPLQHRIAYSLKNINMPIIMVGAAFDFISRVKPQAPKWMQNIGLEWLFRLIKEPKRLFKRYIIYGLIFMFLIMTQKLFSKKYAFTKNKKLF